jgi:NADH dehydrogenase FAD-containing subunit
MFNFGKEFAEPFEFQSMGMLAYIGKYQALTDVKQVKMQGMKMFLYLLQYGKQTCFISHINLFYRYKNVQPHQWCNG